jgi:drug/metabolite transporter (DMT)-like permease
VSRRAWAEAALLFNTILWGTTFVLVKQALNDVSPLLFLAMRFSLATAALVPLFVVRAHVSVPGGPHGTAPRKIKNPASQWAAGVLCGTFLFSGYILQTLGLRLTTPPKSAFLTGLTSVMVPFGAALVYKIRPQVSEVVGVMLATAGLALMTLNGPVGAINSGVPGRPAFWVVWGINPGDLLTVLCAVGFAAHIVTLGHFSERMRFEILSIAQVGAAAAWSLGLMWGVESPRVEWRPAVVWTVVITGLLATALAFTVQAWAMQYTTATRTALIYMFEPVVAWATSFWLVGEGLSARAAGGAALILLGILMVELKPWRQRQHPST